MAITKLARTLTPIEPKKLITSGLAKLGASAKAISGSTGTIHGVTFFAEEVVAGSGAKLADIFLVTQRHTRLYIL